MAEQRSLTFGPFRLDLLQSRLWRETQHIAIRHQAFAVLRYLVMHSDRLVTKAELLQHVWGGRQVTDSVLRGCIHAIRVALADTADTPQYLATVGRQGYQFQLGRAAMRLPQTAGRPVVGRQGEVEWLCERWLWAREGRRQCALLSGEAGIGKTTVVDLFVASLPTTQDVGVGRGHCVDLYGAVEPYLPLLEALGQLGQSPHRDALRSVLQRYAPTWLAHLPALLGDGERERLQRQLPDVTPVRMLRELAEALDVLTRPPPLVLVLEDLQWSDGATVNVLTYLAQRRDPARLLVLGTYRPADVIVQAHPLRGVLQELRGRGHCDDLALELLCPDDVEAYSAARLGGEVTTELVALLYRQVLAARVGALQRLQVHRRMGKRLAQGYGAQTPTITTQLAHHFGQGRVPQRAVRYLPQA